MRFAALIFLLPLPLEIPVCSASGCALAARATPDTDSDSPYCTVSKWYMHMYMLYYKVCKEKSEKTTRVKVKGK